MSQLCAVAAAAPVPLLKKRRMRNLHGRLVPEDGPVAPRVGAPARVPPEVVAKVSAAAKLELAAMRAMEVPASRPVPGIPASSRTDVAKTIGERDQVERDRVVEKVVCLLARLGDSSPRAWEVLEKSGAFLPNMR